ncbi:hypothetical protein EIP91_006862 [Steccherinum ochraceum]|uniref:Uncharacterized protein n=1 Tax=Steccherinum ochraceum TaxID=92696 RepID=A0A4V2MXC9_9APHY|nr:hypothetical protein EIP91_006862 [Steccherinum ochraceum]
MAPSHGQKTTETTRQCNSMRDGRLAQAVIFQGVLPVIFPWERELNPIAGIIALEGWSVECWGRVRGMGRKFPGVQVKDGWNAHIARRALLDNQFGGGQGSAFVASTSDVMSDFRVTVVI